MTDMAAIARDWALAMTRQQSVTGSAGEARFGPWLAHRLARTPEFANADIETLPVAPGDPRQCVLMLIRGQGRRTVLLTGHYDTVTVDDYGALATLATEPEELRAALIATLSQSAATDAARRALADLKQGGDYLPGRGLLDMKSGLAAGLAVAARFAAHPSNGNILFAAVPDEENNSAGARALAPYLPRYAEANELDIVAAINLDAIADNGDGTAGQVAALGSVGKLLPTAFVAGVPTHSGFPLNGINAAAIAGAIAARVEWAHELTDLGASAKAAPPSLLSIHDGKPGYDVTTPATAFVTFNVLSMTRGADEVHAAFRALCAEAANTALDALKARAAALPQADGLVCDAVPVLDFADIVAAAHAADPTFQAAYDAKRSEAAGGGATLPDQCFAITQWVWARSGLPGPAVVVGFASIPYLAAHLSDGEDARRLRASVEALSARHARGDPRHVGIVDFFPGISDVSFVGEADGRHLALISANTPAWGSGIAWPERDFVAGIPTINLGPWGRDYHTRLERLYTPFAFDVLPFAIAQIMADMLAPAEKTQPVVGA